jgi:cytochrome P450
VNASSSKHSETNLDYSWRRYRRAARRAFTKPAVRSYHPVLKKEAILFSSALFENPDSLEKHLKRFSASAILSILYDYPTLKDEHDKILTRIHAFIDLMSAAAIPGAHLVESFPWMIHIPERRVLISPAYLYSLNAIISSQVCKVEA